MYVYQKCCFFMTACEQKLFFEAHKMKTAFSSKKPFHWNILRNVPDRAKTIINKYSHFYFNKAIDNDFQKKRF